MLRLKHERNHILSSFHNSSIETQNHCECVFTTNCVALRGTAYVSMFYQGYLVNTLSLYSCELAFVCVSVCVCVCVFLTLSPSLRVCVVVCRAHQSPGEAEEERL